MNPTNGGAFRDWTVLAGAMLVLAVGSGTFFFSYSVFLPAMSQDLDWGRAVVAAGLSTGLLAFGLPGPIVGASIARFGPRANIIWGNLLAAAALAAMSQITEPWHLCLLFGLVGLGSGFGLFITCTAVINDWFTDRRALAMGLGMAASGLAGFAFPPFLTWLIEAIGWETAWLTLGGIHLAGAVLIGGLVLVRDKPRVEVHQAAAESNVTAMASAPQNPAPRTRVYETAVDWTTREALRMRTTWLIAILGAVNFFAIGIISSHQVAYLQDIGYSAMTAALVFSVVAGASVVSRLAFGFMAARFEVRHLAAVFSGVQVVGFAILLTCKSLPLIYLYAVLFGFGYGVFLTALPTFLGSYYGRTHYAQILGFVFPVVIVAEAIGPPLAGAVFDTTGGYEPILALLVATSFIGLVSAIFARPPKLRRASA
jgi:MFS family permease